MRRYAAFAYQDIYDCNPLGGWDDLLALTDTEEEACSAVKKIMSETVWIAHEQIQEEHIYGY